MWEYRVRKVEDKWIRQTTGLGKSEPSDYIEAEVNKLASKGWQLMPMTLQQTAQGNLLLVFRRETGQDGGAEGLMV